MEYQINEVYSVLNETDTTILMPAYNEEEIIEQSIELLEQIQSESEDDLKFIIVDDGSIDKTFDIISNNLDLVRTEMDPIHSNIKCKKVKSIYKSVDGNFIILKKPNGGRADALNAGLRYCSSAVVLITDADCYFDYNTVERVVSHFVGDDDLVALGGNLRLINEQAIEKLKLDLKYPDNWLVKFQTVEYFRSFVSTRIGWSRLKSLPIISGAFGAFRTEYVDKINGFDVDSIGEDMELTMRIHINNIENETNKKIVYDPYSVIWTDAPSDVRSLKNQRSRWHKGLMYNILKHKYVILKPSKYKRFWFVYLYLFLEWVAPLMELMGVTLLILSLFVLGTNPYVLTLILAIGVGYILAILFSYISIYYQYDNYSMYEKKDIRKMLLVATVEPITYHFIVVLFNIHGIIQYLRGDTSWGKIKRKEFMKEESG